jgi:hypothetical protein
MEIHSKRRVLAGGLLGVLIALSLWIAATQFPSPSSAASESPALPCTASGVTCGQFEINYATLNATSLNQYAVLSLSITNTGNAATTLLNISINGTRVAQEPPLSPSHTVEFVIQLPPAMDVTVGSHYLVTVATSIDSGSYFQNTIATAQ